MRKDKRTGLTVKQENFCINYVTASTIQGNAQEAYRQAYDCTRMKSESCSTKAQCLLKNPLIQARVEELRNKAALRAEISVGDVVSHWVQIALADPNELIQHRRICCRYCYGKDHKFQGVELVYAMACAKAVDGNSEMPRPPAGGFGFDSTRPPNASCPMCFGEGTGEVHACDTRRLKGSAKLLYKGIKHTKYGVEILMRDQDDAMRNVAKFLGMFKERVEHTGKDGAPLIPEIRQIANDPIEASKIYQTLMGGN